MILKTTEIKDLYVIEPTIYEDNRGHFFESYNELAFAEHGLFYNFVQDNQSLSNYGTIRGLHFQSGAFAQSKLVFVSYGSVLDVAVDLRRDSDTFGKYVSVELSSINNKRFLIPKGFAHGFSVLSEKAIFHYKCDNVWNRESECGIRFDDPDLNIDWKVEAEKIIASEKDKALPCFKDINL